jgi:hypothetical protein
MYPSAEQNWIFGRPWPGFIDVAGYGISGNRGLKSGGAEMTRNAHQGFENHLS